MMEINEATGVTPSRQVAAALRDAIAHGTYRTGSRIPSARDLAEEYGVALTTAVRAIEDLRAEGVIETKRGKGSFVLRSPELFRRGNNRYLRNPEGLAPNRSESAEGGWTDTLTDERWREPAKPDVAARLQLDAGDEVTVVRYVWSVDGQPIQVSTQYEPLKLTEGTPIEQPVDSTRGNPGVIARFDSIGLHVDRVEEQTRSRMPSTEDSRLLQLGPAIPVFKIVRTHWAGETPVETADITIRGDRMVITATHEVPMLGGN
jgi:GntR family transcriptional regulator